MPRSRALCSASRYFRAVTSVYPLPRYGQAVAPRTSSLDGQMRQSKRCETHSDRLDFRGKTSRPCRVTKPPQRGAIGSVVGWRAPTPCLGEATLSDNTRPSGIGGTRSARGDVPVRWRFPLVRDGGDTPHRRRPGCRLVRHEFPREFHAEPSLSPEGPTWRRNTTHLPPHATSGGSLPVAGRFDRTTLKQKICHCSSEPDMNCRVSRRVSRCAAHRACARCPPFRASMPGTASRSADRGPGSHSSGHHQPALPTCRKTAASPRHRS